MISGERLSDSAPALAAALRREQIMPISISERKQAGSLNLNFSLARRKKKVKQGDVAIFTRQFAIMLDAGLPLVQCLEAIGQQHSNATFKEVLGAVRADVESGSALSDAMAKHPRVFDNLYTSMIAAGETGGILDTILQRLAIFIEKIVKLKRALRSAMIYPSIIIFIAVAVVTIIMWKVIPVFRTLFEGFGVSLPLLTRIVMAISAFVEGYIIFVAAGIAVGVFALKKYHATEGGKHAIDKFLLRLPILGDILRKIGVGRFTRTLATLQSSGVPILEGLDITSRTSGNSVLSDAIGQIRQSIEEGKTIVEPMRESGFFPPMVVQMVSVGEATGELDTMLVKVADYYEEEVDVLVGNLLTIMEPMLLVFLGVAVGGIVIAMYLPLFKLIQVLSGG
jgi:type IV pilus assembly protein PilC